MLIELRIKNFRTFTNESFRFSARHLVIGKNNSGKTNLCLALVFPRLASTLSISDAIAIIPGGAWDFCNYALADKDRLSTFSLVCELELNGRSLRYQYDLAIRVADTRQASVQLPPSRVASERLAVSGDCYNDTILLDNDGRNVRLLHESRFERNERDPYVETQAPVDSAMLAKLYELPTNPAAIRFRDFLYGLAYFNLSAERIRNGWRESRDLSGLGTYGENLAQMVYSLKTTQESRYRRVLDRVRTIEPTLSAINFLYGPDQNVVPMIELKGGRTASWGSLSDGTLRALGLAYLLECASFPTGESGAPPPVVIVEEPENSLFVGELRTLLDEVENVASTAQVIFTTHSPYFIELFDDDLDAVTLLQRQDWHTTGMTLGDRRGSIEASLQTMSLGEQYFRDMLG